MLIFQTENRVLWFERPVCPGQLPGTDQTSQSLIYFKDKSLQTVTHSKDTSLLLHSSNLGGKKLKEVKEKKLYMNVFLNTILNILKGEKRIEFFFCVIRREDS